MSVELGDRDSLLKSAATSLNSKVCMRKLSVFSNDRNFLNAYVEVIKYGTKTVHIPSDSDIHVLLQVVSQYSSTLSPLCVDAVLKVINPAKDKNVDLRDIKVHKLLG